MAIHNGSIDVSAVGIKTKTTRGSVFVVSLVLFGLINCALVATGPLPPMTANDFERIPEKPTWESHRTRDFNRDAVAPDVVLFGSSLMMIPTACRDADFLQTTIDPVVHPYSKYLQAKLAENCGAQLKCFNFALPGGMISDHYMAISSLFTQKRKPRLVIFGLSLRDFIDSGVECPAATTAYHYFSRYKSEEEIEALIPLSMPHIFNRSEYLANKYVYLFGKRLQLQLLTANKLKTAAEPLLRDYPAHGLPEDESKISSANPDAALSGEEVVKGMVALQPNAFYPWQDNSREYKKRFAGKNNALFAIEKEYLAKTLNQLQEQGVEVLLVNMPLTAANIKLMPPGSYGEYMNLLSTDAEKYGCTLLDLNDGKTFVTANFKDPVHMNGSGGKVLIDQIAAKLSSSPAARLKSADSAGHASILTAIASGAGSIKTPSTTDTSHPKQIAAKGKTSLR